MNIKKKTIYQDDLIINLRYRLKEHIANFSEYDKI